MPTSAKSPIKALSGHISDALLADIYAKFGRTLWRCMWPLMYLDQHSYRITDNNPTSNAQVEYGVFSANEIGLWRDLGHFD